MILGREQAFIIVFFYDFLMELFQAIELFLLVLEEEGRYVTFSGLVRV